ncbi:helicase-associated domain-containing protein [Corynebacterium testudinoris]|uniref:Helicase conserved C-terminal domain n=1 Tax=Corynebacterium testudinoris TaxID=136857 RepID=A0A0G3HAK3_9CORY|nr:helicase-associated domain-containing protein [Corynebacterium testudinoris]AKK08147.1 Helicase conserved C-terminal domain [Corynebacterium testudinoris]MBX8996857.1 helicase-associated domain-containing protein [Corynebacterium testudinoris]
MTSTPDRPDFRTWLAQRSDDELSFLLAARPDVVLPLPPGITPLAARLQLRASVGRALRTVTALELALVEVAAELGAELEPISSAALGAEATRRIPSATPAQVGEATERLFALAIFFGSAEALLLVTEAMPSLPQDWQLLDNETPALPEDLPAQQRAIVDTLLHSGGVGTTKHAAPDADPAHPIPQLLAAGLLTRVDAGTVRLPRRIRAALLGRPHVARPLVPSPRVLGESLIDVRGQDRTDTIGAGAGLEVARHLRQLLDVLGEHPVELLKDGGVGVRVTASLSRQLGVSEVDINRLVFLGTAARLLSRGEEGLGPTQAADEWLEAELGTQWLTLLRSWLDSPWAPWLVGDKDEKKLPIRLLSEQSHRPQLPEHRQLILSQFTRPAPGVEISDEEMFDDFFYTHPIPATLLPACTVEEILSEARWLGALAGGTATSLLRALLDPTADAEAVAADVTPGTVERVIAQADMTILAPGPLPRAVQAEMELLGDLDSGGLASVYRVTEHSVRRALDTGRTAEELKTWLADHVLGEVPQSITYLIDDVARRHGTLRGGPALSYVRCDDPALLLEAARTPAADDVALQIIAPTVAISQAPLVRVIDALRGAGFQPVAEDASGAALDIRPKPLRLPTPDAAPERLTTIPAERIAAAVSAIRRADDSSEKVPAESGKTLAVLQAAARGGRTVTLGFVDKHGLAVHRVVTPLTVSGGQVDALDEVSGDVQRFMLHRITEVLLD